MSIQVLIDGEFTLHAGDNIGHQAVDTSAFDARFALVMTNEV